ncbi:DUF3540 domain-containing protein [Taylorella equigenitalis]|uniref:DUF3540 domain-containing protein n=3 Tax=Taylorella equigenitalis TaxID=29575 RepID=A0A654KF05_TAYEM|nr:DUF3540 domain-containing protein [Taylorella equigenitalis]ADU90965.1 hypothetical protein TEQUI_0006 [Taylorella equigenitalis MCE9]AFN36072.1 hypothetical protein KUI_1003 [Taylorella equigenitalis ATCC 35865]ASY30709.1 hypothetical protein B9Z30_04920 [Taylorella equigenitalis]ASY38008.1 DUF3540 domain-containing protein [Taylorella equigenitalis]ASY39486.1 hypothetical protein CA604_05035 [Taylorella equigenitalis]
MKTEDSQNPDVQSQLTKVVSDLEKLMSVQRAHISKNEAIHSICEVINYSEENQSYSVSLDGNVLSCERAASCLLEPSVGDKVLVSGPNSDELFIIAIVKQKETSNSKVKIPGNLTIQAEELSFRASKKVDLKSDHLQMKSNTAEVVVDSADYVGSELRSTVSIFRFVGKVYELITDRLAQMSRNTVRITEQIDQTRAGTIDYQAEDSARVHSKYTMVTAGELVKVDSEQIHMG